jgi:IMP dehydrogenase
MLTCLFMMGEVMDLMFNAHGLTQRGRGLTFDDVLLVPRHSSMSSRRDPNLSCQVTRQFKLDLPIVTANMDTITGLAMAQAMAKLGGLGIIHRFMSALEQVEVVKELRAFQREHQIKTPIAVSIGVKEEGQARADMLVNEGVEILTIDIAHGDSVMMMETLQYVKKKYPKIDVIAGNVATPEAVRRLIEAGADAVKVGIGPGSMCTTRIITGHGVPQLTAIALCAQEAMKHKIPVIGDGGLKTSGDMVKALAAGANCVMVGSMVSGTLETPGEIKSGRKQYRGMASKSAQVSWRGELPKGMAAEGESTSVACKGPVSDIIDELSGGIRSGMTYMGVESIGDMVENSLFMEMSASGMTESRPHGVQYV